MGRWQPKADGGVDAKRQKNLANHKCSLYVLQMATFSKIKFARNLRRKLTPPEVYLWVRLRKRIDGQPIWRRQHPFEYYVFDFYCPAANLVVEIDGESHIMGDNPQRDIRRNNFIEQHGFKIMRIAAKDVLKKPDEVADSLRRYVFELSPP